MRFGFDLNSIQFNLFDRCGSHLKGKRTGKGVCSIDTLNYVFAVRDTNTSCYGLPIPNCAVVDYLFKIVTMRNEAVPDSDNALGNYYGLEVVVACEYVPAYVENALGDNYRADVIAFTAEKIACKLNGARLNGYISRNLASVDVYKNVVDIAISVLIEDGDETLYLCSYGKLYGVKRSVNECRAADKFYAVGKYNISKNSVGESICTNIPKRRGESKLGKIIFALECIVVDLRNGIGHTEAVDGIERKCISSHNVVRYYRSCGDLGQSYVCAVSVIAQNVDCVFIYRYYIVVDLKETGVAVYRRAGGYLLI